MRVSLAGDEARAKSEIRQLETNINGYKAARHVNYLPSFGGGANGVFRLRKVYNTNPETAANASVTSIEWQYLNTVFPGLQPGGRTGLDNGLPNLDLDCNQTLIFFLTGGEVTKYSGFSNDPTQPFDTSAASQANRTGKYFDIPDNRLQVINGVRTGRYLDPWGTPYVYMAPVDGRQYPMPSATADVIPQAVLLNMGVAGQPTGINPFRSFVSGTNTKAINDSSFQLISAGPNKIFGRGSFYLSGGGQTPVVCAPYTPGSSPYSDKDPGGDDFANFRNLKLSATSD
jgi:hypothetical protein